MRGEENINVGEERVCLKRLFFVWFKYVREQEEEQAKKTHTHIKKKWSLEELGRRYC